MKLLKSVSPLHTDRLVTDRKNKNCFVDYFGSKVAIYFNFMDFYMKWLIIPAVFGVTIQYLMIDSDAYFRFRLGTFYCLMIMIWATLFVKFWERKTNELKVIWGTYGNQFRIATTRSKFKGQLRVNTVTQLPEFYYSKNKKRILYFTSFMLHLPFFLLACFIATVFLNLKGNVIPGHWIYFSSLAELAQPGALLGKNSNLRILVSILQVFIKIGLTNLNSMLSKQTTNFENHRTHMSYHNSLITKRFLFGIISTFLNLTYIAFMKLDVDALRDELISLYASDEIRRLIKEALIPYIFNSLKAKRRRQNTGIKKLEKESDKKIYDQEKKVHQPSLSEYVVNKVNEINQPEYNSFEDYYEMIMQFAYITLFAAAFPLAGAVSLFLNFIEVRSDSFKVRHNVRRPIPEAVNGIGSWLSALKVISFLCVITNSILIAYTAEYRTTMHDKVIQNSNESQEGKLLGIVFAVEHIMLGVTYALRTLIKNQSKWVRVYVKRNIEKSAML